MYKHILIATDGSELSASLIQQAVKLAKTLGASLTAVTVTLPFRMVSLDPLMVGYTEASYRDEMRKVADDNLAAVSAEADQQGISCHLIYREHEHPWEAIINTAQEERCDLIAMASHGRRGISAVFMGSQTNKVLTHSSIPVLVTRPLADEK